MIRSTSPALPTAPASTLAVVSASVPCERRRRRRARPWPHPSPAPCAARRLVVRRHRHEADLAAAGGRDELQRHLDAVAVGLVEDQLPVALQGVGGGIQLAGERRIGDLLDTDDHVHKASMLPGGTEASQSRERRLGVTRGYRPDAGGAVACGALRVLLVVNSFAVVGDGAQHGRRPPRLEPAATTSRSSRPTGAATPPGSPTTPPVAASTWSSGSAATAR